MLQTASHRCPGIRIGSGLRQCFSVRNSLFYLSENVCLQPGYAYFVYRSLCITRMHMHLILVKMSH